MVARGDSGWTRPQMLLAIANLAFAAFSGYVLTQKNDSDAASNLRERIRAVEVRVDGLERRER